MLTYREAPSRQLGADVKEVDGMHCIVPRQLDASCLAVTPRPDQPRNTA